VTLRMIDTFSGIGGFSLAARWLGGIETVQFVEREPYCQRILQKHWPTVPIHDDICTYDPEPGSADIVCGGFPCQDISIAGKQAGIKEGTRSGLFYELIRVVRLVGPQYIVLENVAAITSNGLDAVLGTLAEAGYDCEWACIPASAVGACHQRDRWWAVAYASGSDQSRRAEGSGRRISSAADAGGRWIPEGSWQPNGNAPHSHNARAQKTWTEQQPAGAEQCGELGGGSAAYSTGEQRNDLRAARSGRQAKSELGDGDGTDAADAYHERQQECQPAAVAGRQRWPCWGNAPRQLNPNWRSYLSEPVLRRGNDGLSGRVDRLKALGNAVVPLARVLELDDQLND
jgi:DNA (cytosine-5)-methyltransferase 1